ncbi:AAA family ATPase [Pseudomonas sp. P3C3]
MSPQSKHQGRIKISGYKSLDNLEIKDIGPFMVFAGPNASGKSNVFDALKFASSVLNYGATRAIKESGGFKSIHCRKRKKDYRKTFNLEIDWPIKRKDKTETLAKYQLKIHNLDSKPVIYEKLLHGSEIKYEREGKSLKKTNLKDDHFNEYISKYIPEDHTSLNVAEIFLDGSISRMLSNIKKYAIDPNAAREPSRSETSDAELEPNGKNLAAVLSRLEREDQTSAEEICELISHLVPSIQNFKTEESKLDTSVSLNFREVGHASLFPPGLISDGTFYILCILVAALTDRDEPGLSLIEEPERGIHPKAMEELSKLLQNEASWERPIFLTTHSESIIRTCNIESIVFLNKVNGITKGKSASLPAGLNIPLDEAWLTNMLNGGLPW